MSRVHGTDVALCPYCGGIPDRSSEGDPGHKLAAQSLRLRVAVDSIEELEAFLSDLLGRANVLYAAHARAKDQLRKGEPGVARAGSSARDLEPKIAEIEKQIRALELVIAGPEARRQDAVGGR